MKKNRLLLMLTVSIMGLMPVVYAQEVENVEGAGAVTKQQLEQFLSAKQADTNMPDVQSDTPGAPQQAKEQDEQLSQRGEKPKVTVPADAQEQVQVESRVVQEAAQVEESNQSKIVVVTESPTTSDEKLTEVIVPAVAEEIVAVEELDQPEAPVVTETSTPGVELPTSEPVVEQEVPVVVEETDPLQSSLDTIDIEEGGNWYLKRRALQDTVRKIEDINALYDDIRDTNVVFLQGINVVDVLFTKFNYDVGMDLGRVDQLVLEVSKKLEADREKSGDLSEAERELLQKTEERKKDIEQLRSNISDIWQAQAQLKEARALNDEQIIESDRLRKQAWRNFRMIERVLSEVKAEELYNETVQLFEAMQGSYRYLQTRLIPHFEQSIKIIQEKIKGVQQQADELQKLGILLKEEATQLENIENKDLAQESQEQAVSSGWFGYVKTILWAPFAAVGSLWNWITGSSSNMDKYLPDQELVAPETKQPDEL